MTHNERNDIIRNLIEADNNDLRYIANRLVARRPAQAERLADFLSSYIQIFDMKNSKDSVCE